ncbi:MAG: hypothetical protein JO092_02795 [Candidatus Eremiobacteraeota bacterium]|nr:hypothetical protein [Candidatus Eremiobacteraeota bacterium]
MSFILRWLGLSAPKSAVGLHPRRDLELPLGYDVAHARVLAAIERTLGATVSCDDVAAGRVEARFGVVNNERIVCTLERLDDARTAVRIEAYFLAGTAVPARSQAVDALADTLVSP